MSNAPRDGAGHSRVKPGSFRGCLEKAQVPLNWLVALGNMDRQDAQDKQDGTLLHRKLTPPMVRCGLVDAQDAKPAVS